MTLPRRRLPETITQAQRFDANYAAYRRAGFCGSDAAHASDGHSLGFTNVDPVRDCCRGKALPEQHVGERAVTQWVNGGAS